MDRSRCNYFLSLNSIPPGSSNGLVNGDASTPSVVSVGYSFWAEKQPVFLLRTGYLANGVAVSNIFGTDRDDDENSNLEWKEGNIHGHHDQRGDDDVDIAITSDGDITTVNVAYRNN